MNSQIKITKDLDKIWFTADHHFGHKNIIDYCNRSFETIEEMDDRLINNWNEVIEPGDIVYHLGDFTLGNAKLAQSYFSRLNGSINILSNPWHHDGRWLPGDYFSNSYTEVVKLPPMVVLEIPQRKGYLVAITLCHYPLERWDRKHYGSIHLHGHCHGKLPCSPFRIDVGVDAQNYCPISLNSILEMVANGQMDLGDLKDEDLEK